MPSNDKARRRKHAVRLTEINEKLAQIKAVLLCTKDERTVQDCALVTQQYRKEIDLTVHGAHRGVLIYYICSKHVSLIVSAPDLSVVISFLW
jgi:hypothetical protein